MKVHVLFDDTGKIIAISHPRPAKSGKTVLAGIRPGNGQHVATLEVPEELRSLRPRALHDAVRVERVASEPRIVAK